MTIGRKAAFISFGLAFVAVAYYVTIVFKQVTLPQAQKAQQAFFDEARSKVASTPGYHIVKESNSAPYPSKDEMSATDYDLTAEFLVQKNTPDNATISTKEAVSDLVGKLPRTDYGINVQNTPTKTDKPVLLCVYASRYLNNDGTYILQGTSENQSKYIDQADLDSGHKPSGEQVSSRCSDLL